MNRTLLVFALIGSVALNGCASYSAARLPSADVASYSNMQNQDGLKVAAKFLDARETKSIFGVDKVYELYQPIYIVIDNRTGSAYQFNKRTSINIQSTPAEEVSKNCGFNTAARATSYGVAGLFIWPLLIPAVVDGVGSSNANQKMQADFMYKEIQDDRIIPNGLLNGVIFVNKMKEGEELVVRLHNVETDDIKLFSFKKI